MHVPHVVAELAVEGLVAGADELNAAPRFVSLQVGDSEVGHIGTQGRAATGTLTAQVSRICTPAT